MKLTVNTIVICEVYSIPVRTNHRRGRSILTPSGLQNPKIVSESEHAQRLTGLGSPGDPISNFGIVEVLDQPEPVRGKHHDRMKKV